MPSTIPIMDGLKSKEVWNLDDASDLTSLGFNNDINSKKVDRYVKYDNNKYALVEFTSSKISKGVKQLEECVKSFNENNLDVDYLIMVIDHWSSREKRVYKKDNKNNLLQKWNNKKVNINTSKGSKEIKIFTDEESRRTHNFR